MHFGRDGSWLAFGKLLNFYLSSKELTNTLLPNEIGFYYTFFVFNFRVQYMYHPIIEAVIIFKTGTHPSLFFPREQGTLLI